MNVHLSPNLPFIYEGEDEKLITFHKYGDKYEFIYNLSIDYELKDGIHEYEVIYSENFLILQILNSQILNILDV